ncbi:MAG: hypothetical protein QOF76_3700 [Solirubrobacteraceae bacterium]|jgi:hypothetical protein|nr:hypothetical protein [Solirubrobacteraceae bacterium]
MRLRELVDDEREFTVESLLLTLVGAVHDDEDEQTAKDVLEAAKKRRRRIGLVRLGTGPFAGVAGEVTDLYVETATVCDLSELHRLALTDAAVAAHMLVLWGVYETVPQAAEAIDHGTVSSTLSARFSEKVGTDQPITAVRAIKILWRARSLRDDLEGTSAVGAVVMPGRQAKKFIKTAERLLLEPRAGSGLPTR